MTEELSGRSLEIAVAKALGLQIDDGVLNAAYYIVNEDDSVPVPAYLTDPVAFATVLAALDGTKWTARHHPTVPGPRYSVWVPSNAMVPAYGDTLQEVACRAYVKWSQSRW